LDRHRDDEFRGWVQVRRPQLRRFAYLICADWYLADDLVQDCLVRLYGAWPRLAGQELDNYARRVIANLNTDHRRRPARREKPASNLPESGVPDAIADTTVHELLAQALRQVPSGQRTVLALRFFEDLSVEQTAMVLGTSEGNVKSQTSRGLTRLRLELGYRGFDSVFHIEGLQ
jgi:RNA polymerase sigma-70 factor (sigma-E family)